MGLGYTVLLFAAMGSCLGVTSAEGSAGIESRRSPAAAQDREPVAEDAVEPETYQVYPASPKKGAALVYTGEDQVLACQFPKEKLPSELSETQSYVCDKRASSCASLRSAKECSNNINCRPRFGSGSGPGCSPCTPDMVFWNCEPKEREELAKLLLEYAQCTKHNGQWLLTPPSSRCRCPTTAQNSPQEFILHKGCVAARPGYVTEDGTFRCSSREIFDRERGCLKKAALCQEKGGEWVEVKSLSITSEYLPVDVCRSKTSARWEPPPAPPLGRCKDSNSVSRQVQTGSPTWICDQYQKRALEANGLLKSFEPIQKSLVLCTYQTEWKTDLQNPYRYPAPFNTAGAWKSFCRVNGRPINLE